MTEKQFVNGLLVKPPHEKTPFVKARISIKREELIAFLQERTEDWINIDVKESKSGNWYAEINTWKKENAEPANSAEPSWDALATKDTSKPWPIEREVPPEDEIKLEDIPF